VLNVDSTLFLLLFQAGKIPSTTVPTWLALASVIAAPVASVILAYLTLSITKSRERERLAHEEEMKTKEFEHEEEMKTKEFEHSRWDEERKDRRQVYRAMAKATRNPRELDELPESKDLDEILAEIELITESDELLIAAVALTDATADARIAVYEHRKLEAAQLVNPEQVKVVNSAVEKALQLRESFIEEARSELGQPPRNAGASPEP
jgi:mannitol-specific phosphotransferase system IIBC component